MSTPILNYQINPRHNSRMAYWSHGDPHAEHLIICVHGLTGQGRHFDPLAQELVRRSAGKVRVICPDVVGRGHSSYLDNPWEYGLSRYQEDIKQFITTQQFSSLDWVGTSMGGLIGLGLLGFSAINFPWRRFVLNDIGPHIEQKGINRINSYCGIKVCFDNLDQALNAMSAAWSDYDKTEKKAWFEFFKHSYCALDGGALRDLNAPVRFRYDPAIAKAFSHLNQDAWAAGEQIAWQLYDAIKAETLLLWGRESDILSEKTAYQMACRGPKAQVHALNNIAHAPSIFPRSQTDILCNFLLK